MLKRGWKDTIPRYELKCNKDIRETTRGESSCWPHKALCTVLLTQLVVEEHVILIRNGCVQEALLHSTLSASDSCTKPACLCYHLWLHCPSTTSRWVKYSFVKCLLYTSEFPTLKCPSVNPTCCIDRYVVWIYKLLVLWCGHIVLPPAGPGSMHVGF